MAIDRTAGEKANEYATSPYREAFDSKGNGGTPQRIADEQAAIAFSDIRNYVDDEWNLKDINKITPRKALRAIRKIKITTKTCHTEEGPVTVRKAELELWDKQEALRAIPELRGDKPADKHEHTGKDGGPLTVIFEDPFER